MFQWGDLFSDGGASFLGGAAPWGGIGFDGRRGFKKKSYEWGEGAPHACPLLETLMILVSN